MIESYKGVRLTHETAPEVVILFPAMTEETYHGSCGVFGISDSERHIVIVENTLIEVDAFASHEWRQKTREVRYEFNYRHLRETGEAIAGGVLEYVMNWSPAGPASTASWGRYRHNDVFTPYVAQPLDFVCERWRSQKNKEPLTIKFDFAG